MGRLTAQSFDDVLLAKIKYLIKKKLEGNTVTLRYPLEKPSYEDVVRALDVEHDDAGDAVHDLISFAACQIAQKKVAAKKQQVEKDRRQRVIEGLSASRQRQDASVDNVRNSEVAPPNAPTNLDMARLRGLAMAREDRNVLVGRRYRRTTDSESQAAIAAGGIGHWSETRTFSDLAVAYEGGLSPDDWATYSATDRLGQLTEVEAFYRHLRGQLTEYDIHLERRMMVQTQDPEVESIHSWSAPSGRDATLPDDDEAETESQLSESDLSADDPMVYNYGQESSTSDRRREVRMDQMMDNQLMEEQEDIAAIEQAGRRARQRRRRLRETTARTSVRQGDATGAAIGASHDTSFARRPIPPFWSPSPAIIPRTPLEDDFDPWGPPAQLGPAGTVDLAVLGPTGSADRPDETTRARTTLARSPRSSSITLRSANALPALDEWLVVPQPFALPGEHVLGDMPIEDNALVGSSSTPPSTESAAIPRGPSSLARSSSDNRGRIRRYVAPSLPRNADRQAEFAAQATRIRDVRRMEWTAAPINIGGRNTGAEPDELTEVVIERRGTTLRLPGASAILASPTAFSLRVPLNMESTLDFGLQTRQSQHASDTIVGSVQSQAARLHERIGMERRTRSGENVDRLDTLEKQIKDFADFTIARVSSAIAESLSEDIERNRALRESAMAASEEERDNALGTGLDMAEVWTNWSQVVQTLRPSTDAFFAAMARVLDAEFGPDQRSRRESDADAVIPQASSLDTRHPPSDALLSGPQRLLDNRDHLSLDVQAQDLLAATRRTADAARTLIARTSALADRPSANDGGQLNDAGGLGIEERLGDRGGGPRL